MDIDLVGIQKYFGPVHANDDIHLTIPSGTIQGILGENGAGKSTLMKILSGYFQADRGNILLDGQEVVIHSPSDAIKVGIGMLHQDPLDFPPMLVIDNFLVGSHGSNLAQKIFPNRAAIVKEFNQLQAKFNFSLDPSTHVDTLTIGERQQLEILRLLWLGAKILILDEPTTGISAPQKEKLFETLRLLAESGKTILFVSHKLEDVEHLCHRIAILRRGKLVGEEETPYKTDFLVQMMFGKEVHLSERQEPDFGASVLRLTNLAIEDSRLRIQGVNLEVREGEVIGLAGMEGSGQLSFLRTCAGLTRPVGGNIHVKDKPFTGQSYHSFLKNGVAYVPASRMEEGLIGGLSITEHFILTGEQKSLFINQKEYINLAQDNINQFNIRGTPGSLVESLSGGNQQRTLLSLMPLQLKLILMEHPTRGLDVESAIDIWDKLKDRCRNNAAIIFISSDLEEILHYSDRILVFFTGRVSRPIPHAQTSIDELGQLIGGKGWEK